MLTKRKKILVYDEIPIIRYGIEKLVTNTNFNIDTFSCSDRTNLIEIVKEVAFDLIIIDFQNDLHKEFTILKKLKRSSSNVKILVFSMDGDNSFVARCLKNGASGVLNKKSYEKDLIKAINILLHGDLYFSKETKLRINFKNKYSKNKFFSKKLDDLSNREYEVAKLLADGRSCSEISNTLNLAMTTISTYKKRIFLKTNSNNLIELAHLLKNNDA